MPKYLISKDNTLLDAKKLALTLELEIESYYLYKNRIK